MGQALYRKYRSKTLSEVIGQEHITTTLANALKSGAVSHAYLFTGPKGVGKTSIARILAHEINKLPYTDEAIHLDIIEIDAASNNGVENVRELRDKAYVSPTSAPYKVYIIDEVHMLSKPAFNALLKILEEPPKHVIFILATTETHKLPETIISRTQRFTFKPIGQSAAVDHLRGIATKEKTDITDEALQLIALHGGGSFRDSISLLDQVSHSSTKVDVADVQEVLGIAPDEALIQLEDALSSGSISAIAEVLTSLRDQGYQPAQLARQLSRRLRQHIVEQRAVLPLPVMTHALKQLIEVPASHDPATAFEVVLMELALKLDGTPEPTMQTQQPTTANKAQKEPTRTTVPPPVMPVTQEVAAEEIQREPAEETVAIVPVGELQAFDAAVWQQVLEAIKKQHNTLYSVARMATPAVNDDTLVLGFKFPFHQKKINDAKTKQLIAQIVSELTGQNITINCVVDAAAQPPAAAAVVPPKATSQPLETISNIFGGAEVLES